MSPDRRAAVSVTFDNLGEVTDLQRGLWPRDAPLGRHFSVTRALPRILALLAELDLRATFFVEGRNTELYPDALLQLAEGGHEVAYHGWCHEDWAALERSREAELLERGVAAMDRLGVRPVGLRPPGGRLTGSSLSLIRDLGFEHCSPAGEGTAVQEGIVVLPFRWALVDAYHYLPRFAALRERDRGSGEPLPPERFAEALDGALGQAVAREGPLVVLFHPFLVEPAEHFAVLRRHLEAVRERVERGEASCAPCRDVAASIRRRSGAAGPLRLDPTAA